jgi:putative hemolysin
VTEEEILMMVDAGSETGVIEEQAHKMINNVFEFDDLTADDVMTHRTDITAVSSSALVSEVVKSAIDTGFSRIPVYEESVDRIIGVICVKDLLCLVGSVHADDADLKTFMREGIYLPETLPCGEVFKRLAAKKKQMAVIIDEYGGTAGLVTMEDIVEAIVGSIQDEYDDEEEDLIREKDDTFTIDGAASPDDILPQLGIALPPDADFDTMSGFVVDLLGRIPGEDERPDTEYEGVRFTVLVTEDKRITKIKAVIINDNDEDPRDETASVLKG